jgi:hypothetical protein
MGRIKSVVGLMPMIGVRFYSELDTRIRSGCSMVAVCLPCLTVCLSSMSTIDILLVIITNIMMTSLLSPSLMHLTPGCLSSYSSR